MPETDSLNDQIRDAVEQVRALLAGSQGELSLANMQQLMTFSSALLMLNAVAQQQQSYILRNAVTTAAARSLLESDPEKAVELAHELLADERFGDPLADVRELIDQLRASAAGGAAEAAGSAGESGGKAAKPSAKRQRKGAGD